MLGGHVFIKRPCARLNKSQPTCVGKDLHLSRLERAVTRVNAHARICRCLRPRTVVPREPTTSEPNPDHTSPRLAHYSPLAPTWPTLLEAAQPTFWTHFELSPRHAPSATRPASGSFPLEEMEVSPPITAPAAATSPIAGQEGGAGPPRRKRPRSAPRVCLDAGARNHGGHAPSAPGSGLRCCAVRSCGALASGGVRPSSLVQRRGGETSHM